MAKIDNKSLFQIEIFAICLTALTAFFSLVIAFPSTIIVNIQFVLYSLILIVNYTRVKTFTLYQIWIVAYIFIVWSEMRILSSASINTDYQIPFFRFTLSNCAVLIGYNAYSPKIKKEINIRYIEKSNQYFVVVLIVLYVVYIVLSAQSAINNFLYGRSLSSAKGGTSLSGVLISALGTLLPAVIAYYEKIVKKRRVIYCFVYSLPIFIIVLFQATRFKFLFSVLPFLIITEIFNFGRANRKKNFLLLIIVGLLMGVSSFVKENRNIGFAEIENPALFTDSQDKDGEAITLRLAKNMSSEGVVRMAYIADNYFSNHSLHYGKELSFIAYFWVPRSIWQNKPEQLDYWLIREYSSDRIASTFSSASGFIGEARADFGWGCILLCYIWGMLVKRIDEYKSVIFDFYNNSYNIILVSILVPWIFFFVRSPLTSTMTLIWELLIYYIFMKLFTYKFVKKGNSHVETSFNQCNSQLG